MANVESLIIEDKSNEKPVDRQKVSVLFDYVQDKS